MSEKQQCSKCNKKFKGLTEHMFAKHKYFSCTSCSEEFTSFKKLRKHNREHNIKCGECGKKFETEEGKKQHKKVVHSQKLIYVDLSKLVRDNLTKRGWTAEIDLCGSRGKKTNLPDSDFDLVVYINDLTHTMLLDQIEEILEYFETFISKEIIKKNRTCYTICL